MSDKKKEGWFSRRHKSSEQHDKGKVTKSVIQDEKKQAILERQEARKKRTPEQQLQRLDALLGKEKGAKRERVRLLKILE